jgi:predicted anti-sigma-YlaC factor YlaD
MKLRHLLGPRCTRARTLGSARLDGPLTELEQAELDRHLVECAECRHMVAEMAELTDAVRSVPLTAAPAPVLAAAPTPAPAAHAFSRRRRRLGSLAGVAAAAAVAAALGAAVATPWHRTPPRPAAPRSIDIAQRFDAHHPWPLIAQDDLPPMRGARR